jgi:hypothetical protein
VVVGLHPFLSRFCRVESGPDGDLDECVTASIAPERSCSVSWARDDSAKTVRMVRGFDRSLDVPGDTDGPLVVRVVQLLHRCLPKEPWPSARGQLGVFR